MTNLHNPLTGSNIDPDDANWDDFESPEEIMMSIERGMAHTKRYNVQTAPLLRLGPHTSRVHDELKLEGKDEYTRYFGLNHDNGETVLGEIASPIKSEEEEEREREFLEDYWSKMGVRAPTDEEWEDVMAADKKVLLWEIANTWTQDDKTREEVLDYYFDDKGHNWEYDSVDELVDDMNGRYDPLASPEESLEMFQDRYQVLQDELDPTPKPLNYDWNLEMAKEDPDVN